MLRGTDQNLGIYRRKLPAPTTWNFNRFTKHFSSLLAMSSQLPSTTITSATCSLETVKKTGDDTNESDKADLEPEVHPTPADATTEAARTDPSSPIQANESPHIQVPETVFQLFSEALEALARSCPPNVVGPNATVLVLGGSGFEPSSELASQSATDVHAQGR